MKTKRFLGILAFVMLMWMFPAAAQAEGKLNTDFKGCTATITAYTENPKGNMCLRNEDSRTEAAKASVLRVTPSSIRMVKGNTRQLSAYVQGPSKRVAWKSSNTKVATVSSSGRVTAKRYGKAVIYAKANGITKKCYVTVDPSIRLDKSSVTLYKGKTTKLYASVDGASRRVSWRSSNSSVASVDQYGRVRARKAGRATIYARANGKTARCSVLVKEKTDYKALYKQFLSKSKIPAGGHYYKPYDFYLLNIDGKSVPELIVNCVKTRYSNGVVYLIYTVRNNRVCFMGECGRKGVGSIVEYSPKYKAIYIDGWVNGVGGIWSALFGVSGTKLVRKYHAEEYHPYMQRDTYYIGRTDKERRSVSKNEYITFVRRYMSGRKKYKMISNTPSNRNRYLK